MNFLGAQWSFLRSIWNNVFCLVCLGRTMAHTDGISIMSVLVLRSISRERRRYSDVSTTPTINRFGPQRTCARVRVGKGNFGGIRSTKNKTFGVLPTFLTGVTHAQRFVFTRQPSPVLPPSSDFGETGRTSSPSPASEEHRVASEGIFGPVLSVMTFRTPEESFERGRLVGGARLLTSLRSHKLLPFALARRESRLTG